MVRATAIAPQPIASFDCVGEAARVHRPALQEARPRHGQARRAPKNNDPATMRGYLPRQ
jgi:hypothetical protein